MNAMTRDQEAIYDTRQARWQKAPASAFVIYSSVSFYYFDTSIILPFFADLHRRWFGSDGIYVSSTWWPYALASHPLGAHGITIFCGRQASRE
jgi:hypothetical protein